MFKLKLYGWKIKNAVRRALTDERGEVNVVAVVLLIAVAVVLVLLFKENIKTLIEDLLGSITNKAKTVLN